MHKILDKELLKENFYKFIDNFLESNFAKITFEEEKASYSYVQTSISEALFSIELVVDHITASKKILEVGSGLSIASGFLKSQGYNITTLDPIGLGFNQWSQLATGMRTIFNLKDSHLAISAEQLEPSVHGYFDLIFSNNVLEHVSSVETTLIKLNNSLSPSGVMIHNCPNYNLPYEPHFGIPLIPAFPKLTTYILPKKISDCGLWKSINFVTYNEVTKLALKLNAKVSFKSFTILNALQRFEVDKNFSNRHPFLTLFSKLCRIKIIKMILEKIPVAISTPMIFTWKKNEL